MIRKEIISDLGQAVKYLSDYPAVKGSEAFIWGQMLNALSTITKELEEYNKNEESLADELLNDVEGK
jgi:hypothetical protein